MIEIVGLSKSFGAKSAIRDLNLTVASGEVMGFLGPNGAGKTTTIRLLMGLLQPTAGRATICNLDCHAQAVAVKRLVGFLPDEPFLYPYLSGLELLGFVARLHGMTAKAAALRAAELAERFGLAEAASTYSVTYSHGMKKRLALAAAMISDPQVLILDEPTNGLDPRGARDMRELVAGLAASGRTVFLSTHLLDVAERICHRVAIVKGGQLLAVGTPAALGAQFGVEPSASLEDIFLRATEP